MELKDSTVLYQPQTLIFERENIHFFVDGETPNWMSTDERGAVILGLIGEERAFGDCVRAYGARYRLDGAVSWHHVHDFVRAALRQKMLSLTPYCQTPYTGRGDHLKPAKLNEFWIHTNNSCNLTCTHCLVSSHPGGDPGLPTEKIIQAIDESYNLGARRFYFTGGEPFLRKDIFTLIQHVTGEKNAELIVLTNATLFHDGKTERLKEIDPQRLFLQISLDGATQDINDPIRGEGSFSKIKEGLMLVDALGFHTSLTAVVTRDNLEDLQNIPALAKQLGAKSLHLMWPHRRGRLVEVKNELSFPDNQELLNLVRVIKQKSDALEIVFDNVESYKMRVNGQPGTKYDLSNACWDSLCLYSDGHLYPSASFANHPGLDMGDAIEGSIQDLWMNSPVAKKFREASLIQKSGVEGNPFRFFTGGGDVEHSYFYGEFKEQKGEILGEDPYYPLYQALIEDVMLDFSKNKREALNQQSGYSVPIIYHGMGEGALVCGSTGTELLSNEEVHTLHSNCVLSFDVEKPHRIVQEFYGKAAEEPQAELCCPVNYQSEDVAHIPEEVKERFYGCGSPVTLANLKQGEVMLDLGSGGGIDCFIAAKRVGPSGRVVGVDMTDQMLAVATRNNQQVAANLGFDVVEFHKGFLERVPLDSKTADLITSNCVINLSPDKAQVFSEMWRVLKDHGRILISDIVADRPVPVHIRVNEQLWGECLSGALTEEEFLAGLEKAGFYGLEVLKKEYWKEVEGYLFYSVTVRGFKFEKGSGCQYLGHQAIYRGPFKSVMDDEGHLFPRNEAVAVCSDTVAKLQALPYSQCFTIRDADGEIVEVPSQEISCEPVADGGKCC